jgi:protocatechuate 3,4-dioxygenase beta subunit
VGITGENYLRGVRAADAQGTVTFTSSYPAAYSRPDDRERQAAHVASNEVYATVTLNVPV